MIWAVDVPVDCEFRVTQLDTLALQFGPGQAHFAGLAQYMKQKLMRFLNPGGTIAPTQQVDISHAKG